MSVLARTMQVLDVLAEATGPVTLTEISRVTRLPMTTVHRLCAELLAENAIEKTPDGGLQIGGRLWDLGRRYARVERLRSAAARFLHDLHEVTRATVELAALVGDDLVIVDRLAAPDAPASEWRVRLDRLPLATSAAGMAILARTSGVAGPAASPAADVAVREARGTGVVRLADRDVPGRVILAAAIDVPPSVAGAVVLSAPSEQAARSFTPSVLVTARRIAVALGR